MKNFLMMVLGMALLWLSSCKDKTALNKNNEPTTLVIAYAGGGLQGLTKTRLEPTRKYLERELGIPVEFIFTHDYTAVIEAIHAKKVHMAQLSPFSYILASQNKDITPMVAIGQDGKPSMYHSIIITNAKSGINNMNDVKRRAKNLTIGFADPASTSGHLIPTAYLNTIGLDPEKGAFKQTMFAGSHPAVVMSVKAGKLDLGCTAAEYSIHVLERMNMIKPGDIKILWQSEPIVASPIVIRSDINPAFAAKVQRLYIEQYKRDPESLETYLKAYIKDPGKRAYMPIQDSMYNGLRKVAAGIKDLSLVKE